MTLIYTLGDSETVTRQLPDESVDLILTSVPYERKVQYLDPESPLAPLEIGHEETPAEYLDRLLDLTELWADKLTPTGSISVDIGDSQAGSGGAGGDYSDDGKKSGKFKYEGTAAPARRNPGEWPRNKSACGIPEAYRLSLMYGRNILSGRPLAQTWIVRNTVRFCSVNPPRGRQGDKYTPAITEVVCATLNADRFWNEDFVNPSLHDDGSGRGKDWWVVQQQGSKGHPAIWPKDVIQGFITAMCPPDGVVLDPFAGSGLTLATAANHGRHGVGIELNPAYLDVARETCGALLEYAPPEGLADWLSSNKTNILADKD